MRRAVLVLLMTCLLPASAHAGTLQAGAGRADVTPPNGYYMMGWVDSRAKPEGVWTRLFARAIVLERDGRKIALVAMDANAVPGGLVAQVAKNLAKRGFTEQNILITASHTHAQATGWYPFTTYNTVFMSTSTPTDQNVAGTLDPQLYAFMVRQVGRAITRADSNLRPAQAGWGRTALLGLTANRSLEAHLANFGFDIPRGQGTVAMDPHGYPGTIDPNVNVLRVDQIVRGRHVPIGAFPTFANHGTAVHAQFLFYGADHHASADRVFERAMRRAGRVPARQAVVSVFGNSDEGDQSSGLLHWGPAWAEHVGDVEARAFLRAWRAAGHAMSATPDIDSRWTRLCFCGQEAPGGGGTVDDTAVTGFPLFTGSEEGRGPLYDSDHVVHEGDRLPADAGPQGRKIPVTRAQGDSLPTAVPLLAIRIGDSVIVTVPGEATSEVGVRIRAAVSKAVAGSGIANVVVSGLANEYIQYFTTPEEYEMQHYEGGSTLYGKLESLIVQGGLSDLATDLAQGKPAPQAYPFDATNGVKDDAKPFDRGNASATVAAQPKAVQRLARAEFSWKGGARGLDRPLDRRFFAVQRLAGKRWHTVADDLGDATDFSVTDDGTYTARWEVPLSAHTGRYRFVVTANRYRVVSAPFAVRATAAIKVQAVPGGVVLAYPAANNNVDQYGDADFDLTARPAHAAAGRVTYTLGGGQHIAKVGRGGIAGVPA